MLILLTSLEIWSKRIWSPVHHSIIHVGFFVVLTPGTKKSAIAWDLEMLVKYSNVEIMQGCIALDSGVMHELISKHLLVVLKQRTNTKLLLAIVAIWCDLTRRLAAWAPDHRVWLHQIATMATERNKYWSNSCAPMWDIHILICLGAQVTHLRATSRKTKNVGWLGWKGFETKSASNNVERSEIHSQKPVCRKLIT